MLETPWLDLVPILDFKVGPRLEAGDSLVNGLMSVELGEGMREENIEAAAAHVLRGDDLREAGRLEMAKTEYRAALRLNPQFASAARGLGKVFHTQHRLRAAIDCYTQAISEDQRDSESLRNRGRAIVALGDDWRRREDLEVAMDIREGFGGVRHLTTSTIDRALADLGSAIAIEPQSAKLYVDRAIIYLIRDGHFTSSESADVKFAIKDLERASLLDQALGDPRLLLGLLSEQLFVAPQRAQGHFAAAVELGSSIEARSVTVKRQKLTNRSLGPFAGFFARIATRFSIQMLIATVLLRLLASKAGLTAAYAIAVGEAGALSIVSVMFLGSFSRKMGRGADMSESLLSCIGFVLWVGVDLWMHSSNLFRTGTVVWWALASILGYCWLTWLPSTLLTRIELRRIHSQPG